MYKTPHIKRKVGLYRPVVTLVLFVLGLSAANAQERVPLDETSFFESPGKSWSIVGEVSALPDGSSSLTSSKGKGILLNLPTKRNPGKDLYSRSAYGDMDL